MPLVADQGEYEKAQPHLERALTIMENACPEHANMASTLTNLASLLRGRVSGVQQRAVLVRS